MSTEGGPIEDYVVETHPDHPFATFVSRRSDCLNELGPLKQPDPRSGERLRLRDARFITALLCQHSPSAPRRLVGQSRSQNVRMQPQSATSEPDPEAVLRPGSPVVKPGQPCMNSVRK